LASDATTDGLLTPAEIANLDLTGRLVVLSACRTAAGEAIGGEGPLSLARAFLRAGAAAVVASRWPLRDDEAARFFDAFHRAGSEGATVAAAARFARRARFETGSPAGLWAGVAVIGDPALRLRAAESRRGNPLVRTLLLGASLAILVAWGWLGRRAGRS
jgi:CHAT domain-containing protein